MTILYFWIAAAIVFLIIEMITATFYGLSLALASALVAILVFVLHETDFTILQAGVFAVASAVFAFFLPRLLSSSEGDVPQGTERYIWEKRSAKKVGWDLKISLDGVDYLIESEYTISAGDKVEIIGHKGVSMKVKKVNEAKN